MRPEYMQMLHTALNELCSNQKAQAKLADIREVMTREYSHLGEPERSYKVADHMMGYVQDGLRYGNW